MSPGRHQAIIWTNAGILLIRPLGTNFNKILIENHVFSLKVPLKMSSEKWNDSGPVLTNHGTFTGIYLKSTMRCRHRIRWAVTCILGLMILVMYAISSRLLYLPWKCDGCFQRPFTFTITPTTVCPSSNPPDIIVMVMTHAKSNITRNLLRQSTLRFTKNTQLLISVMRSSWASRHPPTLKKH